MSLVRSILETAKRLLVDEGTLAVEEELDAALEQEVAEPEEEEEIIIEPNVDEEPIPVDDDEVEEDPVAMILDQEIIERFVVQYKANCMRLKINPRDAVISITRSSINESSLPGLRTLSLCGNRAEFRQTKVALPPIPEVRVTEEEVEAICVTLSANPLIYNSLSLAYNNLSDNAAVTIADRLLADNKWIKHLDLSYNEFTELAVEVLITAIPSSAVRSLNLSGNQLAKDGGLALLPLLENPESPLRELNLANTSQDTQSIIAIANTLKNNKTLKSLNLDNPLYIHNQDVAVRHIAEMIQVNKCLRRLSLAKHEITDEGLIPVIQGLSRNRHLNYLDLRVNKIGVDGAVSLGQLLKRNKTIKYLNLSTNRIIDAGATGLASGLKVNSTLTEINLTMCSITDSGLVALSNLFKNPEKVTIQKIFLWGNKFTRNSAKHWADVMANNPNLQTDFSTYIEDGVHHACKI